MRPSSACTAGESSSPRSTIADSGCATREITRRPPATSPSRYSPDEIVRRPPITPTTRAGSSSVAAIAGAITPQISTPILVNTGSPITVLAALQATTTCVTPRSHNALTTLATRDVSAARPSFPYGVAPLSDQYTTSTSGCRAFNRA